MGGVNLIVSCTKRKTRESRASLRLRDFGTFATVEDRVEAWLKQLRAERSHLIEAGLLYSGDHWSVVRTILDMKDAARPVRVWVCSAGYGLVTPSSLLAPYDATFAPGQPDSVATNGMSPKDVLPAWWDALATWQGPKGVPCRTIASVARDHPDDFLLVALSDGYMKAVSGDLVEARGALADRERMAIICAGADVMPGIEAHQLPCDSRLQPIAGGALASLNVRLAHRLLQSSRKELALSRCRAMFDRWMDANPEREAPSRTPMSDDEVRSFISNSLAGNPDQRPTPLLQMLRRSGKACEHSRFVGLFREVEGLRHASR
ncbi:hypothetical protein R5W24_000446 [Gemmata sp. JC717]|uniref:hypothetical protein n=1 Tax=Gemmata algarum TaxID=2975278 RepID=UPI0021BA9026|nr:hypothetical protein [Gemmata algarum]MDY3551370.1 hypothetical protein [Gemmata algarum]